MKAFLMYPDRDFDLERDLPPNEADLSSDLELGVLLRAMAGGDKYLFEVARHGLHSYLTSPAEIVYRQHVLADCTEQPGAVRDLYDVAASAITEEKGIWGWLGRATPETILHRSRQVLQLYLRMFHRLRGPPGYSFVIPERDDNGMRALSDLNDRGLNGTANALAQSADHIKAFFGMLRAELGFYLGCLNLRDRLTATGQPVCFPEPAGPAPAGPGRVRLSARGLYDASLALSLRNGRAVGNDLDADGKQLIMITGANQGGKSTFLRSLGLAQLMTQAGMFVAAESFTASVAAAVFTHFKREEDATMEKGKLDEELDRMSGIAGQITPGALLLCNESFASTNEREGSEIARQIIRALTEAGIRIIFVTHLYDLAGSLHARHDPAMLFLRAERRPDGRRTFRLPPGEPLPTSYGQDLYQSVFGTADQAARA
jgi:DNA mismatch repair ATPase MutS